MGDSPRRGGSVAADSVQGAPRRDVDVALGFLHVAARCHKDRHKDRHRGAPAGVGRAPGAGRRAPGDDVADDDPRGHGPGADPVRRDQPQPVTGHALAVPVPDHQGLTRQDHPGRPGREVAHQDDDAHRHRRRSRPTGGGGEGRAEGGGGDGGREGHDEAPSEHLQRRRYAPWRPSAVTLISWGFDTHPRPGGLGCRCVGSPQSAGPVSPGSAGAVSRRGQPGVSRPSQPGAGSGATR